MPLKIKSGIDWEAEIGDGSPIGIVSVPQGLGGGQIEYFPNHRPPLVQWRLGEERVPVTLKETGVAKPIQMGASFLSVERTE